MKTAIEAQCILLKSLMSFIKNHNSNTAIFFKGNDALLAIDFAGSLQQINTNISNTLTFIECTQQFLAKNKSLSEALKNLLKDKILIIAGVNKNQIDSVAERIADSRMENNDEKTYTKEDESCRKDARHEIYANIANKYSVVEIDYYKNSLEQIEKNGVELRTMANS